MSPVSKLIVPLSMLCFGEAACTAGATCPADVATADHSLMQSSRLTSTQARSKQVPPPSAPACGTGGVSGYARVANFQYGNDYLRWECPHPASEGYTDNCGSPSHCAAKCSEEAACVGFTVAHPGLGPCAKGREGRQCRRGRRCFLYDAAGAAEGWRSRYTDIYSKCDPSAWPHPVPADRIICPVLATGVHQGHLVPDHEGNVPQEQWEPYMSRLGVPLFTDLILHEFPDLAQPLAIYEMEGQPRLEHGSSTGIRDPAKNRSRMDVMMSYADPDGVFGRAEFAAAGSWFDAHPHAESHEMTDHAFTPGNLFSTVVLPVFGRCGEEFRQIFPNVTTGKGAFGNVTTHYPTRPTNLANTKDPFPCSPEKLYMRQDDLENIMWRNRFPDDFELF